MTKNIALIACSNGLGHVKRLLTIAYKLSLYGCHCDLYALNSSCEKFLKNLKIDNLNIKNFDTKTSIMNWKKNYNFDWLKKIKNIESYDYVISDNLIEILELRPDSWITGSFFWHNSIKNLPIDLIEKCNNILNKHSPNLICSSLFAPSYFNQYKNLNLVGLYTFNEKKKFRVNRKKDLLISCGYGGLLKSLFLNFVKSYDFSNHFENIWIEPSLYDNKMSKYIKPATYNEDMYKKVSVAIIRPGIGTVTDCLQHGVKIFSIVEFENKEIEFNAKVLEEKNLGYKFESFDEAFQKVCLYINDKKEQNIFRENLLSLDLSGASQTARIILNK